MQSDILPPGGRSKTKTAKVQPMRSLRLRGHSLDSARERLAGVVRTETSYLPDMEAKATAINFHPVPLSNQPKPHRFWQAWSRRQKIIAGAAVSCLVLALGASSYFFLFHKSQQIQKAPLVAKAAPQPVTVPSPLTGVRVAPELAKRPVTAIMIENSTDARPQSGLDQAGVVFEAIAEGGITRFMGLFQESTPQYIGPVRSLRPYYIDFAAGFDAGVAHVGGSPDALAQIRAGGKDLDQFFNSGSYWREGSRAAPHNVYTSFEKMDGLNAAKGYTTSKFTPWPRKFDKKTPTPTAKTIDLAISSALYNVHYDYDAASNSYLRSEAGKPHMVVASSNDKTGQQLKPKVVIALVTSYSLASDGKHSVYGVTGEGQVFIFQDGNVTQGTWHKADRPSQFSFTDAAGQPIKLDTGQAWVSLLGATNQVTYAP